MREEEQEKEEDPGGEMGEREREEGEQDGERDLTEGIWAVVQLEGHPSIFSSKKSGDLL